MKWKEWNGMELGRKGRIGRNEREWKGTRICPLNLIPGKVTVMPNLKISFDNFTSDNLNLTFDHSICLFQWIPDEDKA